MWGVWGVEFYTVKGLSPRSLPEAGQRRVLQAGLLGARLLSGKMVRRVEKRPVLALEALVDQALLLHAAVLALRLGVLRGHDLEDGKAT